VLQLILQSQTLHEMKIPKVTYWLKDENKKDDKKPVLIMLNFSYNCKRLKMSTGLTIKPFQWDNAKSLPKHSFADYSEYKAKLAELEEKVRQFYSESIDKGIIPEPASIKRHLQHKDALIHESDIKGIHTIFTEFLEEKRLEVKQLTMKKYNTLQNILLKEYEAAYKCTLSFDIMDLLFEKKFKHFLTSVKEQSNNTVSKYMDCLKVFLKWAHKKGLHNNTSYTEFTSKRYKTLVIALTFAEVQSLVHLNLDSDVKLKRVRDQFCFQCLTGQRFSDISNLSWQDIARDEDGELTWVLFQIKGNKPEPVYITLVDAAKNILNNLTKGQGSTKVFPEISNQKFNKYIKEICELAGIKSHINNITYSGKKAVNLSGPKFNFISSHTARKSFVSICKHHGNMSNDSIRAITGHTNDKMLDAYTADDPQHVIKEMRRAWSNI
jgi:integrase